MSGLLPFLSFLLVAAAGGGAEAKLAGVAAANSETVAAYWQTALPSSPIPLAVLDLFTPTDDKNERIHKSAMEGPHISGPRKLGKHSPIERKTKKTRVDEFIKLPYNYGPHKKEANQNTQKFRSNYGPSRDGDVQNIKAFPYWYGPHGDGVDQKIKTFPYWYGSNRDGDVQKIKAFPYWYGPHGDGVDQKIKAFLYWYGPNRDGDVQKIKAFPYWYSPLGDGVDQKIKVFPYWYGSHRDGDDKNIMTYPYNYGPREEGPNQMTHTFPYNYGPVGEVDDQKTPKFLYNYGPVGEADDQKIPKFPYNYGPVGEADDQKIPKFLYWYGPNRDGDVQKIKAFPYWYGPHGDRVDQKIKAFPYWYGSHRDGDDQNIRTYPYNYGPREEGPNQMTHTFPYNYGPVDGTDDQKIPKFPKFPYNYGPVGEADDQKIPKFPYNYGPRTKFGERQAHVHGHGHGNDDATDIFFSEDILTQGSLVTPHIQPTTSSPVLLRRDVADSIPFSTKSFADVVAMFAPASLAMADDIRLTLDVCEHPRPIEGEKITCATSLESLVEFPVSELGTQDVRAFSSDVPREGTASRRYNITALRVVTDSSTKTATCHDMAYPYAVFYCHTVHADSPTRTYMVTLASEDGGDGAPAPTMEALAVCHLNTSKWDPNHPFFVKRHVKPGDTTVCHFLTRGSFLWAPTANTSRGAEQVAAQ